MVSLSTLALLATGLAANAKLSGWPDDFAIVQFKIYDWRQPFGWMTSRKMCEGWGTWCDESKCHNLESIDISPRSIESIVNTNWQWVNARKSNAALMDLWRGDGETFNMFEQNGNGQQQGQCQLHHTPDFRFCKDGVKQRPQLNGWQW